MPATFKPLKGHKFHAYTDAMLRFVIEDAGEAALRAREMDPLNEGKYLDQMNDAMTVLGWRQRTGARSPRAMDAFR